MKTAAEAAKAARLALYNKHSDLLKRVEETVDTQSEEGHFSCIISPISHEEYLEVREYLINQGYELDYNDLLDQLTLNWRKR